MRKLLLFLLPALLAAQTLQFGANFAGFCTAMPCELGAWYPSMVTAMAADSSGNTYVTGISYGTFPLINPIQSGFPGFTLGVNAIPFAAKIDPTGTKLLYMTPIGSVGGATAKTMAVDSAGNAYITGSSSSGGFPTVSGTPLPASKTEDDAFLIKLDPTGKLLLSTMFGGSNSDAGTSVAVDLTGAIYLTGTTGSSDFPVTTGTPLSGAQDIFLAKLDATGKLAYATLLGPGSSPELSLGPSGDVFVGAETTSTAWTTTSGASQQGCAGTSCDDIIALRFRPSTSQMIYATYLGGTGIEHLGGIASDTAGSLYVAGTTYSFNFPGTPGALLTESPCNATAVTTCGIKAFAAHFSPAGALLYSTYLGGATGSEKGNAVVIDAAGNAYIAGSTTSSDFPAVRAVQSTLIPSACGALTSGNEAFCAGAGFLTTLNPQGNGLVSSTYLGRYDTPPIFSGQYFGGAMAVVLDSSGNVYVGGDNLALNPVDLSTPPAIPGREDASVIKISQTGQPPLIESIVNAAPFAPGVPYAGGLASLFVSGLTGITGTVIGTGNPLPTTLSGVTVKLDGEPAPLLAVAALSGGEAQINFQIPFDRICPPAIEVDANGSSSAIGAFPVAPGIFTLSDGTPAIQHAADYSLVTASNPVIAGETIIIYATGLGPFTPSGTTGVPASGPAQLEYAGMTVIIGHQGGLVLYAGPTPGTVGLYQINCQVFSGQEPGLQNLQLYLNINPLDNGQQGAPVFTTSNAVTISVAPPNSANSK